MRIPIHQIDETALIRDRTAINAATQDELQQSIAANGLRMPIEVFAIGAGPDPRFALISGYRRLMAVRALHEITGDPRHAGIEALIRKPASQAEALAAMVEENEIRAPLSPWERAHIAIATRDAGTFDTLDTALAALYPHAPRQKRFKLRAVAEVVEALDGTLAEPETLTERRLIRIANALRLGWGEILEAALATAASNPTAQWQAITGTLQECEGLLARGQPTTPNEPRRISHPRSSVTIRRERTRAGYLLHVTGRGANDALVTDVLEEVERLFS
ncbi:ParB/RepB/Spo0J family partition protein [Pseudoruegeria sp. HB172150]|uniref:ParB/RepB/Spo0J family partition protein n=1 Tax=Pseudoruegeria sp. HB172150 TaxID=2721164 RepID=UPI001557A60B|nr:ParB/RepB/Spo0J family partition protein [Pseudoruegeria sp. HB172150]